jgi:hypothetical protein
MIGAGGWFIQRAAPGSFKRSKALRIAAKFASPSDGCRDRDNPPANSAKILNKNSYSRSLNFRTSCDFLTLRKIPFARTNLSVYFASDPVQCPHRGLFPNDLV